jgi:uncharacterized protein (DUF433 family)
MLLETRYEHIILDENGRPTIAGTTMKVKELVAERLAWGWSAEELLINHPDLTLGKIYSGLAYYADHQEQIDAAIAADLALTDSLRENSQPSPLVARLKRHGTRASVEQIFASTALTSRMRMKSSMSRCSSDWIPALSMVKTDG